MDTVQQGQTRSKLLLCSIYVEFQDATALRFFRMQMVMTGVFVAFVTTLPVSPFRSGPESPVKRRRAKMPPPLSWSTTF